MMNHRGAENAEGDFITLSIFSVFSAVQILYALRIQYFLCALCVFVVQNFVIPQVPKEIYIFRVLHILHVFVFKMLFLNMHRAC